VIGAALDTGSAAAHRGHCPGDEELGTVMDIVENLLQATLLMEKARRLRQATPQRNKQDA